MNYSEMNFKVYFNVKGLEGSIYGIIPGLKEAMQSELIRVYNIYADKTNAGITDKLNKQFDELYPSYNEDNKGKEWYERKLYLSYMAAGYNYHVCNEFNKSNISELLDFYVEPNECIFTGVLKVDHNVTIDFYMKAVND